jgi:hypothetical protein
MRRAICRSSFRNTFLDEFEYSIVQAKFTPYLG